MKEVTVFIHDGSLYQERHHIWDIDVDTYIAEWGEVLFQKAKKANMDHYIYCTKIYDKNNNLFELNIYMQPLDNVEFYKRTNLVYEAEMARGNSVWFGVWHKGTNY